MSDGQSCLRLSKEMAADYPESLLGLANFAGRIACVTLQYR